MSIEQPVPKVTNSDVERVIIRDFGADHFDEIKSILNQYGIANHESEVDRVRLALLKLAKGDIRQLKEVLDIAKRDYRDVLLYAEYPSCAKVRLWELSNNEKADIYKKDWKQYKQWLDH